MNILAFHWDLWGPIHSHVAVSSLVPSFEMLDHVPPEKAPLAALPSLEDEMAVSEKVRTNAA